MFCSDEWDSELIEYIKKMTEQTHEKKDDQKIVTYLASRGTKKEPVICPVTKVANSIYMIHVNAEEKLCVYCETDDNPWEICEAANIQLVSTWVVA